MKRFAALALVSVLALAGCANEPEDQISDAVVASPTETTSEPSPAATPDGAAVVYPGQDGRTALELLQAEHEVELTGEGEMAFVTSIDGVAADSESQYWAFYVNGHPAQVGAGGYETQDSEIIAWKLESL